MSSSSTAVCDWGQKDSGGFARVLYASGGRIVLIETAGAGQV